MPDQSLRDRMIAAMGASKYKWRTAKSIARELKVSVRTVNQILRSSDAFVRAKKPNARGEVLYTTSDRYRRETPFFERLLGAAANTVSQ